MNKCGDCKYFGASGYCSVKSKWTFKEIKTVYRADKQRACVKYVPKQVNKEN